MQASQPQKVEHKPTQSKHTRSFYIGGLKERSITISSDFDSGNMCELKQLSEFSYRLSSCVDCGGTDYHSNSKSWFYFSAVGFPPNTPGKFINKQQHGFRVCYYSSIDKQWMKLEQPCNVYINNSNQVEISFVYDFRSDTEQVKFAMSYPYEYSRCESWVHSLYKQYYDDDLIQFDKEVIIKTPQDRNVYLLSVTEKKTITPGKVFQREPKIDTLLFEDPSNPPRPLKDKKPVVLISARVHPGQTPSSYACEGMLKFLLNKEDLRAQMLLKFFTFKIIPMLNPDGVYHGHYRMDVFGQNLNRYYSANNTDPVKQPAIYALKTLMEHYSKQGRLLFYFDLHAHPARKGCFMYGNALSDFVSQAETYLFCKLIALNTKYFEYSCCNFSKKHMKLKDRFQELTKEGCGRVFAHRCSSMVHSFTLQLGYHFTNALNEQPQISNPDFAVTLNRGAPADGGSAAPVTMGYKCLNEVSEDRNYLNPSAFENVGQALLVSILDTFQKNPYSRVTSSQFCTLQNLRRTTAYEVFHEQQRFRMYELHTYSKVKHINELIDDSFYSKYGRYLNIKEAYPEIVDWPAPLKKTAPMPQSMKDSNNNNGSMPSISSHMGINLAGASSVSVSPEKQGFSERIIPPLQDFASQKISLPENVAANFRSNKHARSNNLSTRRFSLKAKSSSATKKQETERDEQRIVDSGESSEDDSDGAEEEVLTILNQSDTHSPRKKHSSGLGSHLSHHFNESILFESMNKQPVKQVNLTFQQNMLMLPPVNIKPDSSFSVQIANSLSCKHSSEHINNFNSNSTFNVGMDNSSSVSGEVAAPGPAGAAASSGVFSLKEQLLKQFEHFKKEFKEEFSKVIKNEVSDQINKNSFVRNYLRHRRGGPEGARWRRNNKFLGATEKELTVQPIKPEEKSRLSFRLPSIGK